MHVAKRRARRKPAEARHARRRNNEEDCCCVDCDVIVELGQGGDTLGCFSETKIEKGEKIFLKKIKNLKNKIKL